MARRPGAARTIGLLVVLVVALGACGGPRLGPPASTEPLGSIGVPGSSGPVIPPPSLDTSAQASPPGSSDAPPGTAPAPLDMFANHADPDLEARLPSYVDLATLHRFSLSGAEFLGADRGAAVSSLLSALGKSQDDFTFAAARDATGRLGGSIDAYRVKGVDATALRDGIVGLLRLRAPDKITLADVTLGGRQVTHVTFGAGAPDDLTALPPLYLFADGDTVFLVSGPEAQATALVSAIQ